MELLIALPIIGELLSCLFVIMPVVSVFFVVYGFVLIFWKEMRMPFLGLFMVVLGGIVGYFTLPLAWGAIQSLFHLFN